MFTNDQLWERNLSINETYIMNKNMNSIPTERQDPNDDQGPHDQLLKQCINASRCSWHCDSWDPVVRNGHLLIFGCYLTFSNFKIWLTKMNNARETNCILLWEVHFNVHATYCMFESIWLHASTCIETSGWYTSVKRSCRPHRRRHAGHG